MPVDEKVYTGTSKKAHTQQKMKELSADTNSSCAHHLGYVLPTYPNIPLDHIVMNELHLILRIMDVLIRKLILYADSEDHRQKEHHGVESHIVRKLELAIHSGGASFQIWQNKEPSYCMVCQYLEATIGLHCLVSTSWLFSRSFLQRWTLVSRMTFLHMLQSFGM